MTITLDTPGEISCLRGPSIPCWPVMRLGYCSFSLIHCDTRITECNDHDHSYMMNLLSLRVELLSFYPHGRYIPESIFNTKPFEWPQISVESFSEKPLGISVGIL